MELPRKTYQDIIDLKPCFDPANPANQDFESPRDCAPLCTRDWKGTALDILRADQVDAADRLWVVLRTGWLPERLTHEFLLWCAEEALKLIDNPDPRSTNALVIKRLWLDGKASDEELDAARAAASAAAWAAASAAASAAAQVNWLIAALTVDVPVESLTDDVLPETSGTK